MKLRISSESRRAYTIEATLVLSDFMETQVFHEMAFDSRQTTFSHLEAVVQNDQEYFSRQDRVQDTAVLDATSQFAVDTRQPKSYVDVRLKDARVCWAGSTQIRSQV
jgi:hypothetical protein